MKKQPLSGTTLGYARAGRLVAALCAGLCAGLCPAARADERFSLTNSDGGSGGVILASGQVPVAEVPRRVQAQVLLGDAAAQDLLLVGLLDGEVYAAGPRAGLSPAAVLLRYGRVVGRGELRPLGLPLTLPVTVAPGAALRAALTTTAPYPSLVLAAGDGWLRFFDSRSGAKQALGSLGEGQDLSRIGVTKVAALLGLGTRLFVADGGGRQVVRLDIPTGAIQRCALDAAPLRLDADVDKVVVTTEGGRVVLPETCGGAVLPSLGGASTVSAVPAVVLRDRGFQLSERSVDLLLPQSGNPATGRQRVEVTLPAGAGPVTLAIDPGTCAATRFLVSDTFGVPKLASEVRLFVGQERQVLTIEQSAPGESCTAALLANNGASGAAPLRVRGAVEGAGTTVLVVDRSFSMELPLSGPPQQSRPPEAEQRGEALRQGLALLLSTLAVLPQSTAAGRWAVLPFGDGVDPSPATGLATTAELISPDGPRGLRVRGFAGSTGDALTPNGGTQVALALRAGAARVALAPGAADERGRRLWLWTDGLWGPEEGELEAALRQVDATGAGLRLLGLGGAGLAPLPVLLRQGLDLAPRVGLAPRGTVEVAPRLSRVQEGVVRALVRDVLGGRSLPARVFGELRKGQPGLAGQFALTGGEPWLLMLAAWDHEDTQAELSLVQGGATLYPRCLRLPSALVCSAPAQAGIWQVGLRGGRDAGPETALLRVFAGGLGTVGAIGIQSSLTRALYRSGDSVQVAVRLREQGLPLRAATVRARVLAPPRALGTAAARAALGGGERAALTALAEMNGDLARGQARAELVNPPPDEEPVLLAEIALSDDGKGADGEASDGVYAGQFKAALPGAYRVEIVAEHRGVLTPPGVAVDELTTVVVTALDEAATRPTVKLVKQGAGLRVTLTPQDGAGALLGPGQTATLDVLQGGQVLARQVRDLLDGSYELTLPAVSAEQDLRLRSLGGVITVADAAAVASALRGESGCAVGGPWRAPLPSGGGALGLLLVLSLLGLGRRRLG